MSTDKKEENNLINESTPDIVSKALRGVNKQTGTACSVEEKKKAQEELKRRQLNEVTF